MVFSNFKKEELQYCKKQSDFDLSLEGLFDKCKLFLDFPKQFVDINSFKHEKKTYYYISKAREQSDVLIRGLDYKSFSLGAQLCSSVKNHRTKKTISCINQVVSIIFTNSDTDIKDRIVNFENLNAFTALSCYAKFVSALHQVKKRYPLMYEKNIGSTDTKKDIEKSPMAEMYSKAFYWEILGHEIAKEGVFNIFDLTPIESVNKTSAEDVLHYYNLKIAFNS